MQHVSFNNVDELKRFLVKSNYIEVNFFRNPDFVPAVIGVAETGVVIYSYDLMVDYLADIYANDDSFESDNYVLAAMDYIDYNVSPSIPNGPIILYRKPMDGFDVFFDVYGLDDALIPYTDAVLGLSGCDDILFDRDKLSDDDMDNIDTICSDLNVQLPLFV